MLDDILQQLPDERATRRLLNVLDKLESGLSDQRRGSKQAAANSIEVETLRQENLALKFRQKKAFERLDSLLQKLPSLFPELNPAADQEAA